MTVRLLPPILVNRIAAGEVVERPSSAVKELVENAIDAGATKIDVILNDGGKAAITVIDNGSGMSPEEMNLAVERHATSKLPTDDLFDIHFLGFRGEALPSIASVSRMTLTSRVKGSDSAWSLFVEGGTKHDPEPVSAPEGTRVEIRDLFYAVPARLKFLKTSQTETGYIQNILERLAMAHPTVAFTLSDEKKKRLDLKAVTEENIINRLADIVGKEFLENTVALDVERDGIRLKGFVGLPTLNKATAADQYFFVNGRSVKDKVLLGAVKGAYQQLLASDRHPVLVLFLTVPSYDVDVNVHPAKAEVRFRDAQTVRSLLVTAIRQAIVETGYRTSSSLATEALNFAEKGEIPAVSIPSFNKSYASSPKPQNTGARPLLRETKNHFNYKLFKANEAFSAPLEAPAISQPQSSIENTEEIFPPLGIPRAQLHKTYIISQTEDGIVIVDQHAAHERLTYERINEALLSGNAASQYLLLPEVVELGEMKANSILKRADEFHKMGLLVEPFGDGTVLVRGTPALLGEVNVKELMTDIADTLSEWGEAVALKERLKDICATMACHGSIRAGRKLDASEMNALLRQMESIPYSGQCIHGRPTYIELKLKDIEKLFGRRS